MRINQYLQPSTLDEAAALMKEPDTAVLGGGAWIRLNSKTVERALDISPLGLNTIERKNDELILGAMVTLRQIETDPQLNELWNRVIPRSIEHIVGVQMRNIITLGGTLFGRYGFSDLLTALSVLPAHVLILGEEPCPIDEWLSRKLTEKVLVTGLSLKIDETSASYQAVRRGSTDFSILTAAASRSPQGEYKMAVGARPSLAQRISDAEALLKGTPSAEELKKAADLGAAALTYKDDVRASGEYRKRVAPALLRRALEEVTPR